MGQSKEILVAKFGSSVVTAETRIDQFRIDGYAMQLSELKKDRHLDNLIVVTSGAVAAGRVRYEQIHDDSRYVDEQVLASLGSGAIYSAWENAFEKQGRLSGQLLVTHREIDSAEGDVLTNALRKNAAEDVITIANENDLLSVAELKKLAYGGDNDGLAAHIAQKAQADILLLLSDVDGFMTDGEAMKEISAAKKDVLLSQCIEQCDGTGGMVSKIEAGIDAFAEGEGVKIVHIGHAGSFYEGMLSDNPEQRPGTRVVQ